MRRNRLVRLWVAWITLVAVLGFVAPTAAFAGTLTSASFTTAGSGYPITSAKNTRYDYAFTTATSVTVSRVSETVPSGTNTYGARYLALHGVTGNYAATPDSVANSVTGDIDLRAKVALDNWSAGAQQTLIAKWNGSQCSFVLLMNSGRAYLYRSVDGTSQLPLAQSSPISQTNGQALWVRATLQVNNGSNQNVASFYTSTDGAAWTAVGSTTTSGTTSIFDSSSQVEVGTYSYGSGGAVAGKIYSAEERNGINGPVVASLNVADDVVGTASFVSTSPQSETWGINRTGTNLPADVAADLTPSNLSGLPSGGSASLRLLDNVAVYVLATPTSIPGSTPCALSLTGFTNTATAASYTSTITTFDGSGPPVAIDSATTAALIFTAASNNAVVTATIDPTFTFALANQGTACNGESNFVSSGGSATGIALGHVSSSANASAAQALAVASNAGGGFNVYIRGTQASQNLRSASYNWTDVAGSYASPGPLGSGEKFGYTYKDSTSSSSVTNPSSAMFAALTATNQAVMGSAISSNGNSCVSFDAQTAPTTPAGSYSATIVYVALPSF